jgi:hypothetical protein
MTYADTNGFGYDDGSALGDAYGAGLMLSTSVSSGECGSTEGFAAGGTLADSSFTYNGTSLGYERYDADAFSTLASSAKTSAFSRSDDTLALGIAIDGVSSASDFYSGVEDMNGLGIGEGPWPSFFDISMFGTVSAVTGSGSASAGTIVDEARATSSASRPVEIEDDNGEIVITGATSETVANGTAYTQVKANGGYGLSAAGELSGIFTEYDADDDPYAGITSFSALGDVAVAESFGKKDTASAYATASGFTDANGTLQDTGEGGILLLAQHTNATGGVNASAIANRKTDPIAGSVIIGFGMNTFNPEGDEEEVFQTYDATLVASGVLTGGERGEAASTASGNANAEGAIANYDSESSNQMGLLMIAAQGQTRADTFADAFASGGYSLGLSAAGSSSNAEIVDGESEVRDINILLSYAGGEGFGKKSIATAGAGYDAETTGFSALLAPDQSALASISLANGTGSSAITAANEDVAKALTFAAAYQKANAEDALAFSAFGSEVEATDNARKTTASAAMKEVNLLAAAGGGGGLSSVVETNDGVSYITLDPDGKPPVTWDTHAGYVYVDGVWEKSGDQKDYTSMSDPNYAFWYKYAAASDEPIPDLPDGALYLLPILPPVTV